MYKVNHLTYFFWEKIYKITYKKTEDDFKILLKKKMQKKSNVKALNKKRN